MRTRKNRKAGVIAPFSYNDLPRHIENTNYIWRNARVYQFRKCEIFTNHI